MKKNIVVGGAGFIGSHLTEALAQQQGQVVVYDNVSSGRLDNIEHLITRGDNVEMIHGDIMDLDHMQEVFAGAETVFHLAALISVPESIQKPVDYVMVNAVGTLRLLEACRIAGVKNVVLSSSAAIYGDNPAIPKTELMFPEPQSPYAVTKLDGEYYCEMYRKQYGINATCLRYFNVFGPRQNPHSAYAAAVPIFIHQALRGEDLTIFGDGEQTRDFIYVKDIVAANLLAAQHAGDIFNVASGERITINTLAKTIIELTHSAAKIRYLPARPGDIKHSVADATKIKKQLGFAPSLSLKAALAETILSAAPMHEKIFP